MKAPWQNHPGEKMVSQKAPETGLAREEPKGGYQRVENNDPPKDFLGVSFILLEFWDPIVGQCLGCHYFHFFWGPDFLKIRVFLRISAPKKAKFSRAYGAISPCKCSKKSPRFSAIYCSFSLYMYKSTETDTKMSKFSAAFGGFGVSLFSQYFCWGVTNFEDFQPNVAKKIGVSI